jgi:hypothetical protein
MSGASHLLEWARLAKRTMVEEKRVALLLSRGAAFMAASSPHRARLGALCAALLVSASAQAQIPSVTSSPPPHDIPSGCGTGAALDAELRHRLGDKPPQKRVHVSIVPRQNHFHLRVQLDDEVRQLEDESCTELFRAAVVVALAVLMQTEATPRALAPPSPPLQPRRQHPAYTLAGGAGVVVGSLANPVLGLALESKALWRRFGIALDLRYLTSTEKRDEQDKGVRLGGVGAGVAAIYRPAAGWEARLGVAAQRFTGEGRGQIAVFRDDVSWAAGPTGGLSVVAFEAAPFWVGLGAEGQLTLLRARFQIRNYSRDINAEPQDIFVSPWLAASGFVRLGLVF